MSLPPKKRKLTRYPCSIGATLCVVGNSQSHQAEVLDVSLGGARVRCNKTVVHIGDRVEIKLAGKASLILKAKVAFAEPLEYLIDEEDDESAELRWSDSSTGVFGVKFLGLGAEEERKLQALMDAIEKDLPPDEEAA
jgi:hypothetical protein